jgi:ubiquinone/menaquinone biosynthesis C-methylase UbiE
MTSALFDSAAQQYDATFTNTEIGKLQRARVWNYLSSIFNNNTLDILELNCGTGEDAIWFAKNGHKVWATDISEKMIGVAHLKVEQLALSHKIIFKRLDINEIEKAAFSNRFDLIFSNFGGLNCVTDYQLKTLSNKLMNLLNPNGRFVAVVMPDFCLTESVYFLSKFKFKEILRRKMIQQVRINDAVVKTYYYSPKMFYRYFKNEFILNKVFGIGLTIPPSYLNSFFTKKVKILKFLNGTENFIGNNLVAASIADHYLIDLSIK